MENPARTSFADMENMVIKETNGSGGYGIMGNKATEKELDDAKIAIAKTHGILLHNLSFNSVQYLVLLMEN
jgi:uncharacterized circularly permuted ATP-grasp superfamily protein